MSKNDAFKLILISLIFSVSILVIIPRFNIKVNHLLLELDSYVGGYSVTVFGKVFDLGDFKKGIDVGGLKRLSFVIGDEGTQNIEGDSKVVKTTTEKRMQLGGYKEFQVYISTIDGKVKLIVDVPTNTNIESLAFLLSGTGNVTFKPLKNPSEWKAEDIAIFAKSPDFWVTSDISREDVSDLVVSKNSAGQDQFKIVFTTEGKAKFNKLAKENVNKPVAFFVNDQELPTLIPVIDESLAKDIQFDPVLTGGFPNNLLDTLLIQYKSGILPVKISSPEAFEVAPRFGNNFINRFGVALIVGFAASLVLSLARFGKRGTILTVAVFLSTCFLLALIKFFSVFINFPLLSAIFVILFLFVQNGYEIFYKLKLEEVEDKPFNYVLEKVFNEQLSVTKYLAILLFFTMLIVSRFTSGELLSFVYTLVFGSLGLLYFYFVLKTLLETSGGKNK